MQLENLPDTYFRLSSGLGDTAIPNLLLVPIQHYDLTVGVLEIASFEKLEEYKIDFLQKINESIVSVISNLKDS